MDISISGGEETTFPSGVRRVRMQSGSIGRKEGEFRLVHTPLVLGGY